MKNDRIEFGSLLQQLNRRAARSVISQLGFRNEALNRHLERCFSEGWGRPGSFLADPVFEATFGWREAATSMAELSSDLLSTALIEALNSPPKDLASEYQFKREWHPYLHQLNAWQSLLGEDWKSVLVASGTGSGKTECFLIPILEDLTRELAANPAPIVGVRALMLYPLNALINSQRQRLSAWTHAYGGKIRFCLYNGNTPTDVRSTEQQKAPAEVLSRKGLWASPPPILVTNSTMLEYMLVRNADRPILEQSRGKLRWIVLDEAHTYIGTQAAELSLQLRRVMQAFGVSPNDVRFVATSATIGKDDDAGNDRLREFLAEVAGVSVDRVSVIRGHREIPDLDPDAAKDGDLLETLSTSGDEGVAETFTRLATNRTALAIRAAVSRSPRRLSEVQELLKRGSPGVDADKTLGVIDAMTRARSAEGEVFLPLRGHIFERTLGGLWACANRDCGGRSAQGLDTDDWRFGAVYLHHQQFCEHCQSPVYELLTCTDCGTEYLSARERIVDGEALLTPPMPTGSPDEFVLDIEIEEGEGEQDVLLHERRLIAPAVASRSDGIAKGRYLVVDSGSTDSVTVDLVLPDVSADGDSGLKCVNCGAAEHFIGQKFRMKKLGAPFFLGDILPTVLEHCPPEKGEAANNPAQGRRLLTFTDSRQGTARIASRLQQDIDRNYVRTEVYHHLAGQANSESGESTEDIDREIEEYKAQLESSPDILKDLIQEKLTQLEAKKQGIASPAAPRVSWNEMAQNLSKSAVIGRWMCDEFKRITGADISARDFAEFCLYREFFRRPIRVNQAETLGLVRMHYVPIDNLQSAPVHWETWGGTLDEWKDFLYLLVDYFIRANSAVHIPDSPVDYAKWMGARVYPKFLLGPDSDQSGGRLQRWPKARPAGAMSRLVNLLLLAFNRSIDVAFDRDTVNHLFDQAWLQLRPLLSEYADGYQLDLTQQIQFSSPVEAWRCPFTMRVLPTTLRGLSPYQPLKAPVTERCGPIRMPQLPHKFWRNPLGAKLDPSEITGWLENDSAIQELRKRWLWPNRSDRIAAGEQWFAIGEHSAQQNAHRLKALEDQFKQGRVNILSCSTTMEMGVDIGGMSAVAMNNAPPSQANYLQRAGRAGRRKEPASMCVTVCNNNAHGQAVFRHPDWPFDPEAIAVPFVSLTSEVVVQRHVNAFLLSQWLQQFDSDSPKLVTGWLFLDREGQSRRVYDFLTWCDALDSRTSPRLDSAMRALVRHSVLEGQSLEQLASTCSKFLNEIAERWQVEYAVLDAQLNDLLNRALIKPVIYNLSNEMQA